MKTMLALAFVVVGCGRSSLPEEAQEVMTAPSPPPQVLPVVPACVEAPAAPSRWECDTVDALEVSDLQVTWTEGAARVSATVRNTSGQFLNYPGVLVELTSPAFAARTAREVLYGLGPCGEMTLSVSFAAVTPSGVPLTFTAQPMHINGTCPSVRAVASLSAFAP